MCICGDGEIVKTSGRIGFHDYAGKRSMCQNCGEHLDAVYASLFCSLCRLTRRTGAILWGHAGYGMHSPCPLYADVKSRPNPPTKALPGEISEDAE
jgi:hypothetical protein